MNKKKSLLMALVLFMLLLNSARAQSYDIESLDGYSVRINLDGNVFGGRTLAISIPSDTLFFESTGIKKVEILEKFFLKVSYDTRGGSGLGLTNTLFISVKNNKINIALAMLSYSRGIGTGFESIYESKFSLEGNYKVDYKLLVSSEENKVSKNSSGKKHVHTNKLTLVYDKELNIFYGKKEVITKYLLFYDFKTRLKRRRLIQGTFPAINLDKVNYYFINGEWYKNNYKNELSIDYYRSK